MASALPLHHFLLLLFLLLVSPSLSEPPQQHRTALLTFLSSVRHARRINWNASIPTCSWTGVTCDSAGSSIVAVRLPGVGLVGTIPSGTIGSISSVLAISLRSNGLSGPIPQDLFSLPLIRGLFLQNNDFSGPLPESVGRFTSLLRLDISGNNFSGSVPFSLSNLTRLNTLRLEKNHFSGNLPSISIPSLVNFNVSDNSLNGSIPASLSRFPKDSFLGNLALCGAPLPSCNPFFPSPSPAPAAEVSPNQEKNSNKLSGGAIAGIVVGSVAALLIILLLIFFCARNTRGLQGSNAAPKGPAAVPAGAGVRSMDTGMTSSTSKEEFGAAAGAVAAEPEKNKLVFLGKGTQYTFDLEDLLRASAEVLGKGSIGTSYKAVLEEGTTVVVKRLKDVSVTKKDFEQHMEVLGKVEHRNLLLLRAYYYSKDEKLLVLDYLPGGSLSSALHGSRGSGRTPLDWDSRVQVALAASRGLAHLHMVPFLSHGNVKASNVLLRPEIDASVLSDFTLFPLFAPTASYPTRAAGGYRAPEVVETRRPTPKADVYSFGVLLLELLTGKAPNQASFGEEGIDLPRWVQSVVREEWTAEVFDVELLRYDNVEEEMVQLLQIAMACVTTVPDARPDMTDVVRMIEDEVVNRVRGSSDDPGRAGGSGTSGGATPPTAA